MIKLIGNYAKIDTPNTSLIIGKYDDRAELVHYGRRLKDSDDYGCFSAEPKDKFFGSNSDHTNIPTVLASNGESAQKSAYVGVVKNGVFSNRFLYIGAEKVESFTSPFPTARKKGEILRLTFTDEFSGVTLYQYYTVFADSDVIAVHSELVNTTDAEVTVNRLMSLQLDFVATSAELTTFDGTWCHERTRHTTVLPAGRFEIDSKLGISSPEHNPFFMATVNGKCYGFNLLWSGNHLELTEVSPYGRVRIQTGMNDYQLSYPLQPGERLVSPEAITVHADSQQVITEELHRFSMNHVISPRFAGKERPILINNWEGTFFDFDGDKICAIAERAAACGIELMVLDDGWFGKRDNDHCSLGDWYDNVSKTGGIAKLAERVRGTGMEFGIWVEPEMISPDSDLFRAHPEYAQAVPGVEPIQRRHQLCLDLCNPEVVEYLAERLIGLIRETGVIYVKWDHNRSMSDVYSSKFSHQGTYFYDYYRALYGLLTRITEACPDVLFESCASGGCRFDLGMEYFMPQNWGSDNTNAYARLFIQEGTLAAYPQSTMGAHVAMPRKTPLVCLESRFNVAAIGAFGYELDITKLTERELETVRAQVEYYKAHRKLLQFGKYIRLGNSLLCSNLGGWTVVSEDQSEAIVVVIDQTEDNGYSRGRIALAGLDPDALYRVTERPQENVETPLQFTAYGDALMYGGLDLGNLPKRETDRMRYSSRFASAMYYIEKI